MKKRKLLNELAYKRKNCFAIINGRKTFWNQYSLPLSQKLKCFLGQFYRNKIKSKYSKNKLQTSKY